MICRIYGLRVRSDLPLPAEQTIGDEQVDLRVTFRGPIPPPATPPPQTMIVDWREEPPDWLLRYQTREGRVLEFRLDRQASSIDVTCTEPDATDDIGAVLAGPGLAAALHLRGIPILHASAVVVDGRAVLVAGAQGAGKSTMTAMLVRQGIPLLSEDLAVLALGQDQILVQPGSSRLRLYPEAALIAGRTGSDLPRVFGTLVTEDKRWVDAKAMAGGFRATPAPLGAIYVLAPRDPQRHDIEFAPLAAHRAGLALLQHLYGARWLRIPHERALPLCARIARSIPVRTIHAPPGLDWVGRTANALVADARSTLTPAAGCVREAGL